MRFDVIIIGGGPAGTLVGELLQSSGFKTIMIVSGRSIHETDYVDYEKKGGTVLMGDTALGGTVIDGKVKDVKTSNLGSFALQADWFVIATGKYLGKGLVADMHRIYEPVFGLDVRFDPDRENWFNPDFKEEQPFLRFGVTVDESGHPSIEGQLISNLFACGELTYGVSDITGISERAIREASDKIVKTIISERDARA